MNSGGQKMRKAQAMNLEGRKTPYKFGRLRGNSIPSEKGYRANTTPIDR